MVGTGLLIYHKMRWILKRFLGLPIDDEGNSQGIYLKGQLAYSQYYPGTALGWFPDIVLEPTQGYMLNMLFRILTCRIDGAMARYNLFMKIN